MITGAHHEGIALHVQAILSVGRKLLLPENLGHDAEHGAPIEVITAVVDNR